MSTIPVITTGMWFLSAKTKPQVSRALDGTFALTLFCFDRQGPHTVEPWRVTWSGNDAFDFHQIQSHLLQPGAALLMELGRVRLFRAPGKHSDAEFHAQVISLQVLPFAGKSTQITFNNSASSPYEISADRY